MRKVPVAGAKSLGRRVVVDPKGRDYSRYRGADVVTPNRRELAEATGLSVDSESAIVAASQVLLARYDFGAVLVTRAEDGMSLITADEIRHFPGEAKEVFDVSGAGDTAIAVFTLGLLAGASPREAAGLANRASGIAVGKLGTATVTLAELKAGVA